MRAFSPPRDLRESDHVSAILSEESDKKVEINEQFVNDIYHKFDHLEKNMCQKIYAIFDKFLYGNYDDLRSAIVKQLSEMKESINETRGLRDGLRGDLRAEIKNLREHLQAELQDLRENLWYQCDHLKFVNFINSKFYELNNKFEQYIYKPNTQIYEEKIYEKFKHDSSDESKEQIYKDSDKFKHDSSDKSKSTDGEKFKQDSSDESKSTDGEKFKHDSSDGSDNIEDNDEFYCI